MTAAEFKQGIALQLQAIIEAAADAGVVVTSPATDPDTAIAALDIFAGHAGAAVNTIKQLIVVQMLQSGGPIEPVQLAKHLN